MTISEFFKIAGDKPFNIMDILPKDNLIVMVAGHIYAILQDGPIKMIAEVSNEGIMCDPKTAITDPQQINKIFQVYKKHIDAMAIELQKEADLVKWNFA